METGNCPLPTLPQGDIDDRVAIPEKMGDYHRSTSWKILFGIFFCMLFGDYYSNFQIFGVIQIKHQLLSRQRDGSRSGVSFPLFGPLPAFVNTHKLGHTKVHLKHSIRTPMMPWDWGSKNSGNHMYIQISIYI